MLIAQITDTHLFADKHQTTKGFPTWDSLQAVIRQVQTWPEPIDALLLTGDLSQDETAESYGQVQRAIAPLQIPAYWIPGNHDRSLLMQQQLIEAPFSMEKRLQGDHWTVLLLNSAIEGHVEGRLSPESMEWLQAQLSSLTTDFALVTLHHPPLNVGSAWMDAIGLENKAEFQHLLHRFPQVKAVVFGHVHQELDRTEQGIRYLASPSTCVQFMPNSQEFLIDGDRTPGFRLLRLKSDGIIDTWVERVDYRPPNLASIM